ncbi:MAG: hypothetical protein LW808_002110 [Verrucomicrobiota bacterium]|nr:MAG: hypothetical protein LW808_002110 [Verrucomicrobiota bacterium]
MDEKIQKPNKPILRILALALGTLTSHLLWGYVDTIPAHESDQFQKQLSAEASPYVKAPSFQMKKPLVHLQAPLPQIEIAQLHVKEPVLLPDTMSLLSEEEFFGMSWDERDRYLAHLPEDQLVAFFNGFSQKGKGEAYRHLPYRAKKIFWRRLDLEQQGRNFGYIPTSERRLCFEDLDTKWRNWRIGLLPTDSEQFEVFPLLSEEGKRKYCEGLSPEKLQRLIAYLPPEEQQGIPAILTVEALLLQWNDLSDEERGRRFTELPLEKRAHYWHSLSKRDRKYQFQYLPESERVNLWPSFNGDEDSQIWNFRYLPKYKRLELWPSVSYEVRRCNFQSFSGAEMMQLWSDLNELGKGANFGHLPLFECARFWPDLSERWRSPNFRHLRAVDRVRFWGTLAHLKSHPNAQSENFHHLPEDARLAAWEGRILDGKILDHSVQEGLTQEGRDRILAICHRRFGWITGMK